jgi:predicted dienelactone hydrolase
MRRPISAFVIVVCALSAAPAHAARARRVTAAELAGNPLAQFPNFEYVRAFNADAPVYVAVDPAALPRLVGVTADIYVVRSAATSSMGDPLVDAGAGPETRTFAGTDVTANVVQVAAPGELASDAGTSIGVPYDVVIDVDRSGTLSDGDVRDRGASEAGFYVVKDLVAGGPLAVACSIYSVTGVTPGFELERTCYPTSIATAGKLPLVVISHGNGHDFRWYDWLQQHLASYGFIVMTHQNDTMPGVESAATTTLQHTNAILGQQASIGGGVLNGHIDSHRIVWIGHSRGGEGVVIAYDGLVKGRVTEPTFGTSDIKLVSGIAPTDFDGPGLSNPHAVNYHFLYGSADGDVSGSPAYDVTQAFHIFERATGFRSSTYVHGASHEDFNCCGEEDFTGPDGTAVGRTEAQKVAKAVYLAALDHYVRGNLPGKDYLWRQWERFKPIGVAATTTVVNELKEGPTSGKRVIEDYQTQPAIGTSSSGGAVTASVQNLAEGVLDDANSDFESLPSDPMNGMTRASAADDTRGAVFDVDPNVGANFIEWQVPAGAQDFRPFAYLSFRAAQCTQHPLTAARLRDESWYVLLRDGSGAQSLINFSAYGGGIEEPYQRTGLGSRPGWQNEFETIRLRIADFARGRPGQPTIDLSDVRVVAFVFSSVPGDDTIARLGLDDLELTAD